MSTATQSTLHALLAQQTLPNLPVRKGLILCELQKDFLSADGKLPVSTDSRFLEGLRRLVPAFRSHGDVIWVRTEYEADRDVYDTHEPGDNVLVGSLANGSRRHNPGANSGDDAADIQLTSRAIDMGHPGLAEEGSEDEDEELFLTRTASKEPCCVAGSSGAEYGEQVQDLIDETRDMQLVKTYYSAFGATSLLMSLRSKLITELYIAGCITNLSVFATAMDAVRYGIRITLVEDCLGYRRRDRHDLALRRLQDLAAARVVTSAQALRGLQGPTATSAPIEARDEDEDDGEAEMNIREAVLALRSARHDAWRTVNTPSRSTGSNQRGDSSRIRREPRGFDRNQERGVDAVPLADQIFQDLYDEVTWQTMKHQTGEVPRLVCCQGTIDEDGSTPLYRHPTDQTLPVVSWTPFVDRVRRAAEMVVGHTLNHGLIQLYRGGNDFISEHSDKTLDIAHGSSIVSVSFGAQRTMRFRTKRPIPNPSDTATSVGATGSTRTTFRVPLPHNSLIAVSLATNAEYLHGINADKRPRVELTEAEMAFGGQRISLTFRHIATYLSYDSAKIWGQGARAATRETARLVVNADAAESERLVIAFGRENQGSRSNWEGYYVGGSDVLHLR